MSGVILYMGYKISGESSPSYSEGCHSPGTVYRKGPAGSIVQVARIDGKIFKTMQEAEAHGLELAKECGWIGDGLHCNGACR
jgi:hypothetical protein